jgi:hypothetical protein
MFIHQRFFVSLFALLLSCSLQSQQTSIRTPERDAQSVGILSRTMLAAGGSPAISSIHDIVEKGKITFYWSKDVKGPVTIMNHDGNCFRMEADLPEGARTWIVKTGVGSLKEPQGRVHPMTGNNSINLENLTFPLAHVRAALADGVTDISFVGIESQDGHSVYRIRLKGPLGLTGTGEGLHIPVVKDIVIDALNFNIVSVEDRPFQIYEKSGKPSDKVSRVIEYSDYREVGGVLMPFSISTKLMGQKTLAIDLSNILFNMSLNEQDFQN